jgi:hypothetical protein
MRRRPRWSHVVISLGVIAALAIAMPAFGVSISIKKAIKKEVAKQISSAKGPAGSNGTNGTNGLDGTARAYAKVPANDAIPCSPGCMVQFAKGVSGVTHPSLGIYCVTAPGVDPAAVAPAVTVEWGSTASPEGNASAMVRTSHTDCPGAFEVITDRQPSTTVCTSGACGSTASVAGDASTADDVGFTIVIP